MRIPLVCLSAVALVAAAPVKEPELPVIARTLPNGLRVLMVERHDAPSIACGWVARVGSANEQVGQTGLAHLFEHLMFKGTRTIGTRDAVRDAELNRLQDRLYGEIQEEDALLRERQRRGEIADMTDPKVRSERHRKLLAELGKLVQEQRALIVKDEMDKLYSRFGATGLNANTSSDRTFFHVDVPSNKLELWAWLESDRLRNAVFREFYSERDVVLEERRQRTDATPLGKVQEAFVAMQWSALPYHWPVIGWPSDITQVTREQADAFFATYYAPNNVTAILVGDFKVEDAWRVMQTYFGGIPAGRRAVPRVVTTEPEQPAEQRMVCEADANPMVQVSYKTVSSVHRDAAALDVLASVLSGASGRLNRSLVLDKKMALEADAGSSGQRFLGSFEVVVAPVPERKPEEVEALLYQEIARIQQEGITEHELQKVKNQVQAGTYARMERQGGLRDQLAEAEAAGSYRDFLEEPKRLMAVTSADVQRVARQYLVKEHRSVLIVNRKKAAADVAEDPDLASLPDALRDAARSHLAAVEREDSAERLKEGLARLESQAGQAPADARPLLLFMQKMIRARIQLLETKP